MGRREHADSEAEDLLWVAPRVERVTWRLADDEVVDCATYRIVGGQREAFEALRSFSEDNEPVAVDLAGLSAAMRAGFLDFLEGTGLVPVEWVTEDVVVMMASFDEGGGSAGVREPRRPVPPHNRRSITAPVTE
jgi:hypothetical protein